MSGAGSDERGYAACAPLNVHDDPWEGTGPSPAPVGWQTYAISSFWRSAASEAEMD